MGEREVHIKSCKSMGGVSIFCRGLGKVPKRRWHVNWMSLKGCIIINSNNQHFYSTLRFVRCVRYIIPFNPHNAEM